MSDASRLERRILHLTRCVLETATPLSVSTGNPDGVFDTALVTDANDLPALPGSSLAGVLRHLWRSTYGAETHDDELFGHQNKNQGNASRLTVSWGVLLDSRDQAAEGLCAANAPKRLDDPLYQQALALLDEPVFRNRVRLNHRGAATNTGKFDRAVLPRGHRFAIGLRLWSADQDDPDWFRLLNLLAHPALRLGGATRAGLGKLRCVTCHQRSFDLSKPEDIAAFQALPQAIDAIDRLTSYQPTLDAPSLHTGVLELTPNGFWRIGQGHEDPRGNAAAKPADLLPVQEEIVVRDHEDNPRIDTECLLFPAASLKGALAHRLNFHARRFADIWADDDPLDDKQRHEQVDALLGAVKDKDDGQAGALFIDDAFLPLEKHRLREVPHNSIDRFTGGVRNRVLYSELSVHGSEQPIEITLTLDERRLTQNHADLPILRRALKATLNDLCQGRLALGSRTTTGNGFFTGTLTGNLKTWLDAEDAAIQTEQEKAA